MKTQGPAGEGEGDGLLHLNDDGLLLFVHVSGLGELDVANADIAGGGKPDALLRAADHHRLAELREIPVQSSVYIRPVQFRSNLEISKMPTIFELSIHS